MGAIPKTTHIGETHLNNAGENMEIIAYKNAHDITVRFDDGAIRNSVNYYNFLKGAVSKVKKTTKPSGKANDSTQLAARHIGETHLNTAGERMTIIEYFSYHNITIQFDDGTIREKVDYDCFCKGYVRKPKSSKSFKVVSSITQQHLSNRMRTLLRKITKNLKRLKNILKELVKEAASRNQSS